MQYQLGKGHSLYDKDALVKDPEALNLRTPHKSWGPRSRYCRGASELVFHPKDSAQVAPNSPPAEPPTNLLPPSNT